MFIEEAVIILGIVILYLTTNVIVVAFLISVFVYLWFLVLMVDLVDSYLITKNKLRIKAWLGCFEDNNELEKDASSKE